MGVDDGINAVWHLEPSFSYDMHTTSPDHGLRGMLLSPRLLNSGGRQI